MKPMTVPRCGIIASLILVTVGLSGCYYVQAARGHFEVMNRREPIADVVADAATPGELARRLELISEARRFSIEKLALPDNDSYRSYADLERNYVVWNVVAAPEFSLQAKTWCYPIVGCVSYRGYFSETAARGKAAALSEDGYDVALGGVAAYSTLGRFDDPILNTMMHWDDAELVGVMFHELAHQVVYIRDDTGFNESFATAVEEFGLEQWLIARGDEQALAGYRERQDLERRMMAAIARARAELGDLYASGLPDATLRRRKAGRLDALAKEIRSLFAAAGRRAPAWTDGALLNNARIVSMNLYHGRLPEFRRLLDDCGGQPARFYAAVAEIAELDRPARDERLDSLR